MINIIYISFLSTDTHFKQENHHEVLPLRKRLLNIVNNNLMFYAHQPGYSYCGQGKHLQRRSARGDTPVNKLDALYRNHDIFYDREKKSAKRYEVEKILADGVFKIQIQGYITH